MVPVSSSGDSKPLKPLLAAISKNSLLSLDPKASLQGGPDLLFTKEYLTSIADPILHDRVLFPSNENPLLVTLSHYYNQSLIFKRLVPLTPGSILPVPFGSFGVQDLMKYYPSSVVQFKLEAKIDAVCYVVTYHTDAQSFSDYINHNIYSAYAGRSVSVCFVSTDGFGHKRSY